MEALKRFKLTPSLRSRFLIIALLILFCFFLSHFIRKYRTVNQTWDLHISQGNLYLRGESYSLRSGVFYYFRIHPSHWQDRLKKLRSLGFNALELPVPWGLHELNYLTYDFHSSSLFLRKIISLAGEEGFVVILKVGPYIGGDVEFGGLPAWLLYSWSRSLPVRSSRSNRYVAASTRWVRRVIAEIAHLAAPSGPVIALRLEGDEGLLTTPDMSYLKLLEEAAYIGGWKGYIVSSLGENSTELCFADDHQLAKLQYYKVHQLNPTIKTKSSKNNTKKVKDKLSDLNTNKNNSSQVFFWLSEISFQGYQAWGDSERVFLNSTLCSEKNKNRGSLENFVGDLIGEDMMSVSVIPAVGGSNYGWISGGKWSPQEGYLAGTSSYDRNALITESGQISSLGRTFLRAFHSRFSAAKKREHIQFLKDKNPLILTYLHSDPKKKKDLKNKIKKKKILLRQSFHLGAAEDNPLSIKDKGYHAETPLSFEDLHHPHGIVRYSTKVYLNPTIEDHRLELSQPIHDRGLVFLNGQFIGVLSRLSRESSSLLYFSHPDPKYNIYGNDTYELVIIVENLGRVSSPCPSPDPEEYKGLPKSGVKIDLISLKNWDTQILKLDPDAFLSLPFSRTPEKPYRGPSIYSGHFSATPKDGYLSFEANWWHKGFIWVNGFLLGRYWKLGPPLALYIPADILLKLPQKNQIFIYEEHSSDKIFDLPLDEPLLFLSSFPTFQDPPLLFSTDQDASLLEQFFNDNDYFA